MVYAEINKDFLSLMDFDIIDKLNEIKDFINSGERDFDKLESLCKDANRMIDLFNQKSLMNW